MDEMIPEEQNAEERDRKAQIIHAERLVEALRQKNLTVPNNPEANGDLDKIAYDFQIHPDGPIRPEILGYVHHALQFLNDVHANHPTHEQMIPLPREPVHIHVIAEAARDMYFKKKLGAGDWMMKDPVDLKAERDLEIAQLKIAQLDDARRYAFANKQINNLVFKVVYRRHTNFAMESIEQTFNGSADFGKKAFVRRIISRPAKVRVYAINYNGLRIMSGMGGLAYNKRQRYLPNLGMIIPKAVNRMRLKRLKDKIIAAARTGKIGDGKIFVDNKQIVVLTPFDNPYYNIATFNEYAPLGRSAVRDMFPIREKILDVRKQQRMALPRERFSYGINADGEIPRGFFKRIYTDKVYTTTPKKPNSALRKSIFDNWSKMLSPRRTKFRKQIWDRLIEQKGRAVVQGVRPRWITSLRDVNKKGVFDALKSKDPAVKAQSNFTDLRFAAGQNSKAEGYCVKCGHQIRAGDKFCEKCGEPKHKQRQG